MQSFASAKICGLSTFEHAALAADAGAGMLGFVHFPPSPRHIKPMAVAPIAAALRARHPSPSLVAVMVDPSDAAVEAVMAAYAPDFLQLHGKETPARAAALRAHTGRRVIKAISVSAPADLAQASAYASHVDMLMFDAKATAEDRLPGGNGRRFDWNILTQAPLPAGMTWMLSGGLTAENVAAAAAITHAPWVDVSSGVEYQAGKKDPARIAAFLEALRA